jgi:hypothetical protein
VATAATATTLATARTIALTGTVTGTATAFDGSANISISTTVPTATTSVTGLMSSTDKSKLDGVAVNANNYVHPTGDGSLHVPATGTTNNGKVLTAGSTAGSMSWTAIPAGITDHTLLSNIGTNTHAQIDTALTRLANTSGTNTGDQTTITGNAGTATTLATARTINGVLFDGSANITINAVDSTARIAATEKGAVNGVATLDATGKVPSTQLPSFVDDVLEFTNLASFPGTGETGKIYVALDTNKTYRWSGSAYVYITSGAVDSVAGKTGIVTLVKADVGLGNVDNTADSVKSVATAATTTGNAGTATKLATARTITATGDVTSTAVSFDGSANISIPYTMANSGVTAGTYNSAATKITPFTVDSKGRITGTGADVTITPAFASITSKPTTVSGYGITDAATLTGVEVLTNKTITGLKEIAVALPANAIDLNTGNVFTKTISASTTFTVSNIAPSGSVSAFILELTNAGSNTITWFSGIKWPSGVTPTLTASGVDVIGFYTRDGGTTWRGSLISKDSK